MAAAGVLVMPNLISCESDEVEEIPEDEPWEPLVRDNFFEGVASFDPDASSVVLWTRYAAQSASPVTLTWQVATDRDFKDLVRSGKVQAEAERDHTVSIEVRDLPPASSFFYRFYNTSEEVVSAVGETITLPEASDASAQITIAACSCANYTAGYFNVYEAMGATEADVILHLGDYIYEYGNSNATSGLDRKHHPDRELLTLEDYRARYRQYRQDEQLQELHRKKPFFTVWDDHEIADNAWEEGASGHNDSEGNFTRRKADAIRAYSEYLPVRTANSGKVYRRVELGGIASLYLLDTRHAGRDQQLKLDQYIDAEGELDAEALDAACNDQTRTLLGQEQRDWLAVELGAQENKWCLLGQQVLMGKMVLPAELVVVLQEAVGAYFRNGLVDNEMQERLEALVRELVEIKLRIQVNDPGLAEEDIERVTTVAPYNLDAWDGYSADRSWLLGLVRSPVVVISGDSHNGWCNRLLDEQGLQVGHEVAAAAVSSPGLERLLPASGTLSSQFSLVLTTLIDDLVYANPVEKGFLLLNCTHATVETTWNYVSTVLSKEFTVFTGHRETFTR